MKILQFWRRFAGRVDGWFIPREVYFRSERGFRYFKVSAPLQKAVASLLVFALVWVLGTSGGYVYNSFLAERRAAEIEQQRLAYFDLLSEVSEYHEQFAHITQNLEDNQAYLLSVLQRSGRGSEALGEIQGNLKASETERARVVVARESLRRKLARFENDLRDIADRNAALETEFVNIGNRLKSSESEREAVLKARERLGQELAGVERELASAIAARSELQATVAGLEGQLGLSKEEREKLLAEQTALNEQIASLRGQLAETQGRKGALERRVAELNTTLESVTDRNRELDGERALLSDRLAMLENRMVEVGNAQRSLFEGLSEQTRLSIGVIAKTVEMTGLDLAALLAEHDVKWTGQGGPFVPLEAGGENLPEEVLEANLNQLDQELNRWSALYQIVRTLPLGAPLDQFSITSSYGARKDPVNKQTAVHEGTDFAAPLRSTVFATAPGKVTFAGWRGRYGRMIEIDHGHGIRTRYAHLKKILVKPGQEVGHREKIGQLGSSGRSTGPHVHYEVLYNGKPQDPANFLKAGKYVFKG